VLEGGDLKVQPLAQAINLALVPFIAYSLGRVFFPEQPISPPACCSPHCSPPAA